MGRSPRRSEKNLKEVFGAADEGGAILLFDEGDIVSTFMRRIRFTVRFREPDEAPRLQLWKRAFPAGVQVQGLDYRRLAGHTLTGANVKAVAMNASFLAAARGAPITTMLVEEAIARELKRQGRIVLSQASS